MSTYGDDATARPVRNDPPPSGTAAGAEATARMSGTHDHDPYPQEGRTERGRHRETTEETLHENRGTRILPAKTSTAAAFALAFGVAALVCALTAILAPLAVLFGVIAVVLGVVGMKMARRAGITGKGVALGGLVTGLLGLLLGGAVLAGAAVVVNDEQRLDQLQEWIDDRRAELPSADELTG